MKTTKGDKIIIGIVLIINLLSIPIIFNLQKTGAEAVIEVNNRFIGKYSLEKKQTVLVEGEIGITDIVIEDGQVRIKRSPCLYKVCIKMGRIRHTGKIIVCVPNKVVVRVVGDNYHGLDAIVG